VAVFTGRGHRWLFRRHSDRPRNGIWGAVVVAFTRRPLGLRDSTPRPGPSARQEARLAEISERQDGLWWRSFGHARTPVCKCCPRFLPLNTPTVVRRVVSPTATALRPFLRARAPTGKVGAAHAMYRVCIHSFAACVRSASSTCIAAGLLEPRTFPPTLVKPRVQ
jgi:hypothetical protein